MLGNKDCFHEIFKFRLYVTYKNNKYTMKKKRILTDMIPVNLGYVQSLSYMYDTVHF